MRHYAIVAYKNRFKSVHAESVFNDLFKDENRELLTPPYQRLKGELLQDEVDAA